jgi:hypothetical protein
VFGIVWDVRGVEYRAWVSERSGGWDVHSSANSIGLTSAETGGGCVLYTSTRIDTRRSWNTATRGDGPTPIGGAVCRLPLSCEQQVPF